MGAVPVIHVVEGPQCGIVPELGEVGAQGRGLEGEAVETEVMGEQTVGVELTANGRRVLYVPGCATVPDWLRKGQA